MNDVANTIILWSGWIAAIGLAVYEIVKAYRNRIVVQVSLTVLEEDICIGVHNWGRRPVNFVEAGLVYANGRGTSFDEISSEFPFWLYSHDGINLCFKLKEVIEELRADNTRLQYGYFTDESGKIYEAAAGDELKARIEELLAGKKNVDK